MTTAGLEIVDLTELVGEVPILCDYSRYHWCPKGEAKWIVRLKCPGCGARNLRLICNDCKDYLVASLDAMECSACDVVIVPARLAFSSIEPLR